MSREISKGTKDYADAKLQAKLVAEGNVTISEDNKIDVDLSDYADKTSVETLANRVGDLGTDAEGKAITVQAALAGKQPVLDSAQQAAVDSGIKMADVQQIESNKTDVADLKVRMTTAESDIDALQADVGTVPDTGWSIGNETATNIADAVRALNNKTASSEDVSNIKAVVGDMSKGLVKDVADLQTTVGDENSGLVKDVADLKTDMGDVYTKGQVDTALAGKADSGALDDLATKDEVAMKISNIKQPGTYLVNFTETGAVSYAPIQILGSDGQPVSLTTGAVQPQAQ